MSDAGMTNQMCSIRCQTFLIYYSISVLLIYYAFCLSVCLVSGRTSPMRSTNALDEGAVRRTLAKAAIAAAMMQPKTESNYSLSKFIF